MEGKGKREKGKECPHSRLRSSRQGGEKKRGKGERWRELLPPPFEKREGRGEGRSVSKHGEMGILVCPITVPLAPEAGKKKKEKRGERGLSTRVWRGDRLVLLPDRCFLWSTQGCLVEEERGEKRKEEGRQDVAFEHSFTLHKLCRGKKERGRLSSLPLLVRHLRAALGGRERRKEKEKGKRDFYRMHFRLRRIP